jgi:hypothetical protein
MKWDCGPTAREMWEKYVAEQAEWHPFFCWWPRRIGPRDCRWLETIERKREWWGAMGYGGWLTNYRALDSSDSAKP